MVDVNMVIAGNIQAELGRQHRKQVELAEGIGVSSQTVSKMLNGTRVINAVELGRIAGFLHITMEKLMRMPQNPAKTNAIYIFMGRVRTEEAKKGVKLADELSNMILFHSRVRSNGEEMSKPLKERND